MRGQCSVRVGELIDLSRDLREWRVRPMGFVRRTGRCLALWCLFCEGFALGQNSILGFTPSSAARETEIEKKFKAIPSPDEERRQHQIFTSEPHVAGSKRNNELAHYIADEWRKQGLEDVIIRPYDVNGTNPNTPTRQILAPVRHPAPPPQPPLT